MDGFLLKSMVSRLHETVAQGHAAPVFRIRIRIQIHRIQMFLGLPIHIRIR